MTTQALITRIKALRELAEKATPGPWQMFCRGETLEVDDMGGHKSKNAIVFWSGFDSSDKPFREKRANAKHITSHNPAAMIELYDELLKVLEGR